MENRLTNATGATSAVLTYDPLGRLNSTVSGGATTRFLYDGDELVAEYDSAGTMLRRYVHGANTDEPVLWYEGSAFASGNRRILRADHQGSIVAIADSGGTSIAINSYDEWGNPGPGNVGRFAYTGQIILPELGLYHYKARAYSPRLGRFLQTDPVGYDDQINLYAYVANDPVNKTDPTGMLQCEGDSRCDAVHEAADSARQALAETSGALRGLADAINNGTELTDAQTGLKNTFESKFGEGSSTSKNLGNVADRLDRTAAKIGERGQGATVKFGGPSSSAAARAPVGGNRMTIYDNFFSNQSYQGFAIAHEGGHLAGLNDIGLPSNAPFWLGINGKAYGDKATNWLGSNQPGRAIKNNDSHICLVVRCYP